MEKRRKNIMYKTVPVIASVLLLILMLNWWQAKAPNALLSQISAIAVSLRFQKKPPCRSMSLS